MGYRLRRYRGDRGAQTERVSLEQISNSRPGNGQRTLSRTAIRVSGRTHHAERLHHARRNRYVRDGDAGRAQERSLVLVNRRAFLTTTGMAAIGFSVEACATHTTRPNAISTHPRVNLTPVKASWDRVI